MKKLSLFAALALSTILSACGGGGGGHSVPTTTLPSIPNTPQQTSCADGKATCMIQTNDSNANKRLELVTNAEEGTSSISTLSVFKTFDAKNVQGAFNNMKTFLIDENLDDNVTDEDLRKALILAGYKNKDLPKEKLKDWVILHQNEIHNKAQRVWDMYGKEKNIGADNARLTMVNFWEKQDSYIGFEVDKNGNITGLRLDVGTDSADSRSGRIGYDGFNSKTGESIFSRTGPNYIYGIKAPDIEGDNSEDLYLEVWEKLDLSKTKDLDKLKNMLLADLEYRKENGEITEAAAQEYKEIIAALNSDSFKHDEYEKKDSSWTEAKAGEGFSSGSDSYTNTLAYKSYAKELNNKQGLRYADFGTITVEGKEGDLDVNEAFIFTGGYDAKRRNDLQGKMTFEGKAVAAVTRQYEYNNSTQDFDGIERDEVYRIYEGQATLDFENGNETLSATNFSSVDGRDGLKNENDSNRNEWYDVTVQGTKGSYEYSFDDTGKNIDEHYQFAKNEDNSYDNTYHVEDFGYYGDNKTDKNMEAAGYFEYGQDISGDDGTNGSLHAQVGFGAKRTK